MFTSGAVRYLPAADSTAAAELAVTLTADLAGTLLTATASSRLSITLGFVTRAAGAGGVEFGVTQHGYAIRVRGGPPIQVSFGRRLLASDARPGAGWIAVAARQLPRGRFQLLWRNTATGRHALWTLNAAGRRTAARGLRPTQVRRMEPLFAPPRAP